MESNETKKCSHCGKEYEPGEWTDEIHIIIGGEGNLYKLSRIGSWERGRSSGHPAITGTNEYYTEIKIDNKSKYNLCGTCNERLIGIIEGFFLKDKCFRVLKPKKTLQKKTDSFYLLSQERPIPPVSICVPKTANSKFSDKLIEEIEKELL